jgi:hypothetical protein
VSQSLVLTTSKLGYSLLNAMVLDYYMEQGTTMTANQGLTVSGLLFTKCNYLYIVRRISRPTELHLG